MVKLLVLLTFVVTLMAGLTRLGQWLLVLSLWALLGWVAFH